METIAGRMTEEKLDAVWGSALWADPTGFNEAKEKAKKSMMAQAKSMGADSVVSMRLQVTEMSSGVFCMSAAGTAVKTGKLPMATPAFRTAANDDFRLGLTRVPSTMAYEGSALRH